MKAGLVAMETPYPTTPKKNYCVQLGAFSVKTNAGVMHQNVKAVGVSGAFIRLSEHHYVQYVKST